MQRVLLKSGAFAVTLLIAAFGGCSSNSVSPGELSPAVRPASKPVPTVSNGMEEIIASGGGQIGHKRIFSLTLSRMEREVFMSLNYNDPDHGVRLRVNRAMVDACALPNGVIKAAALDFTVDVQDNGEPGSADTFSIQLSNGYSASGVLSGGNIQLHNENALQPCPKVTPGSGTGTHF